MKKTEKDNKEFSFSQLNRGDLKDFLKFLWGLIVVTGLFALYDENKLLFSLVVAWMVILWLIIWLIILIFKKTKIAIALMLLWILICLIILIAR